MIAHRHTAPRAPLVWLAVLGALTFGAVPSTLRAQESAAPTTRVIKVPLAGLTPAQATTLRDRLAALPGTRDVKVGDADFSFGVQPGKTVDLAALKRVVGEIAGAEGSLKIREDEIVLDQSVGLTISGLGSDNVAAVRKALKGREEVGMTTPAGEGKIDVIFSPRKSLTVEAANRILADFKSADGTPLRIAGVSWTAPAPPRGPKVKVR
ncbi:MAG: hypothetical protein HYY93_07760 [Planctomycetes bacterium]|nr:hypothetical protein [Planctomycetota bacterium]